MFWLGSDERFVCARNYKPTVFSAFFLSPVTVVIARYVYACARGQKNNTVRDGRSETLNAAEFVHILARIVHRPLLYVRRDDHFRTCNNASRAENYRLHVIANNNVRDRMKCVFCTLLLCGRTSEMYTTRALSVYASRPKVVFREKHGFRVT